MSAPRLRVGPGVLDGSVDCHRVMVYATHALDNVEIFAVRMAVVIEPSFIVESDRINDEGISLPLANRITPPRGRQILGMLTAVREYFPYEVIILKQHDHLAWTLQNFHRLASYQVDAWHAGRDTVHDRVIGFR